MPIQVTQVDHLLYWENNYIIYDKYNNPNRPVFIFYKILLFKKKKKKNNNI